MCSRLENSLSTRVILIVVLAFSLGGSVLSAQIQERPVINIRGEYVNYETPLIKPILVTADGAHVVALNEPDGRVVVRQASTLALVAEISAGQGLVALAERPGSSEIWVSAMHSASVIVIDTATWRVTHALHAPGDSDGSTGDSASPGGIAFSADGAKAYVVATATDALLVYDAVSKTYIKSVALAVEHNGFVTRMKEPRAIVRSGDNVYVSIFRSGNNSAAVPYDIKGLSPIVLDLDEIDGLSLPDADILAVSTLNDEVAFHQKRVGTMLYGIAAHPVTEQLVITHMDTLNAQFMGERAWPLGRVALNGLTFLTPGQLPAEYNRVALEDLSGPQGTRSLAMPTDMAIDGSGRVYAAGFASSEIGVFDSSGAFLAMIPTDAGPRGLAASPDGNTLYSLNRIAGTLTAYDVSADLPNAPFATESIGLYDPTPDRVNMGRAIYNDASTSGGGSTGCFSCHPDLAQDGVGWELSAYHGDQDGFTPDNPPPFWKDRKFIRTTQDCRSLEDSAPYHWRAEKKDLEDFNGAFVDLLKGSRLSDADFSLIKDFTFSAFFPPNPFQMVDRELSDQAVLGWGIVGSDQGCQQCHTPPVGSRGVTNGAFGIFLHPFAQKELLAAEAASWRGNFAKEADKTNLRENGEPVLPSAVTGYGYDHSGSQFSLFDYIDNNGNRLDGQERFSPEEKLQIWHFAREYDSSLAPSTSLAHMLNQETVASFPGQFLFEQAKQGNCDLAARGRILVGETWQDVGLFFQRDLNLFVADSSDLGSFTASDLTGLAALGKAELLVLGTPVWSGERIGVDRDRDAIFDADELAAGTDPANPDTDGDGFWDSYDDDPLVPNVDVSITEAPQVINWGIDYANAISARVFYETDTFSPTQIAYGLTTDYDMVVGDPLPLPAGSNHWRRHHSIVLRNMKEDSTFHFQIRTVGQNGALGGSQDLTVKTMDRNLATIDWTDEVIFVSSLDLTAEYDGNVATMTATVSVISSDDQIVAGAEVHGVWTLFRNGQPFLQFKADVATTGADGIATVTFSDNRLQSGDEAHFNIPTFQVVDGAEIPGLLDDQVLRRPFAWSENETSDLQVMVP